MCSPMQQPKAPWSKWAHEVKVAGEPEPQHLLLIFISFLPQRLLSRPRSSISWIQQWFWETQNSQNYRGPWKSSLSTSSFPIWRIWRSERARSQRPQYCFSGRAGTWEEGWGLESQNSKMPQNTLGSPRGPCWAPSPTSGHPLLLRSSVGGTAAWAEMSLSD